MVITNWISDALTHLRWVCSVPVVGLVLPLMCHYRVEILPNVFIFFSGQKSGNASHHHSIDVEGVKLLNLIILQISFRQKEQHSFQPGWLGHIVLVTSLAF